jgi:hypothetical protein
MDRAIKELEDKIEYCKKQKESIRKEDLPLIYYYDGQIHAYEYAIQMIGLWCK